MENSLLSSKAERWGTLWGYRPRAWAVNEEQQLPVYHEVLARVAGDDVLDIGCGTGVFLRECAARGARVTGLDASSGLLAVACERVPAGTFVCGDMASLPFADDTFDLVTGFCSFFFAEDLVGALREAGRVARPGAPVVIEVFGDPARCDVKTMKAGASRRVQRRPDAIEPLLPDAGLTLDEAFDVTFAYEYPDHVALVDAMLAAGGAGAVAPDEAALGREFLRALSHCRQPDGRYRVQNEWHVIIARA